MKKKTDLYRFFRRPTGLITLCLISVFISLFALRFGSADMTWGEFFRAIFRVGADGANSVIIYAVRLPRILAGILSGVGLSLAGVILQSVTDNSLASPNVIGVNAGAGFGVIICLAFLHGVDGIIKMSLIPLCAFIGAFLSCVTVVFISSKAGGSRSAIVLSGVAVTALLNAFISMVTLADTDILTAYNSFSVGGFSGVTYGEMIIPALVIFISLTVTVMLSKNMELLCLGSDAAALLGVNVRMLRTLMIVCATASAASVVSFAGLLGFVGLIVPHIARGLVGNRMSHLIFTSVIIGSSVTVLADLIGRVAIAPSEIPVGIMMSIVGAPFFIFLLFKRKGEY